jgi:hypothetical protein
MSKGSSPSANLNSRHRRKLLHLEKSCPTFWFREESRGITCCDCGWLVCVVVRRSWLVVVYLSCVNLGGHGGKSEPKVQTVTPSSSFDHGVSVWSYGSGLAYGVTIWTFGLDFRFQFILRQPECATRRNRKSKPELYINNY